MLTNHGSPGVAGAEVVLLASWGTATLHNYQVNYGNAQNKRLLAADWAVNGVLVATILVNGQGDNTTHLGWRRPEPGMWPWPPVGEGRIGSAPLCFGLLSRQ